MDLKNARYETIKLPKNSPIGVICAFITSLLGFGTIWHIWWLVIVGLISLFVLFVFFDWNEEWEYEISSKTLREFDQKHQQKKEMIL